MSRKKRKPGDRFFIQVFNDVTDAPAWVELSLGARALFIELKKHYHRVRQEAVFLSSRDAMKRLRCTNRSVGRWKAELEHYKFIVKVKDSQQGEKGSSAHYRLTDEAYLGQPPSKEYMVWEGAWYDVPQSKVRTPGHHRVRTPGHHTANGKRQYFQKRVRHQGHHNLDVYPSGTQGRALREETEGPGET
jgi:hypothetical protein